MLLGAIVVSFVSVHVFIIPSNFAPSGIEGVSAILYEITGLNIGWFKLMLNIPLMIIAWIYLAKRYVFYVIAFIVGFFLPFDSYALFLMFFQAWWFIFVTYRINTDPKYNNDKPHETTVMNKAMTWYGIEMKTMNDKSNSKIAELLLNGVNMGIIEGRKVLNNKNINEDVKEIIKTYVEMQENTVLIFQECII